MKYSDTTMITLAVVTFALGIYLGMFVSEANTIFECEKDRAVSISGALWKPGIRYACTRASAGKSPAVGAAGQEGA